MSNGSTVRLGGHHSSQNSVLVTHSSLTVDPVLVTHDHWVSGSTVKLASHHSSQNSVLMTQTRRPPLEPVLCTCDSQVVGQLSDLPTTTQAGTLYLVLCTASTVKLAGHHSSKNSVLMTHEYWVNWQTRRPSLEPELCTRDSRVMVQLSRLAGHH